MAKRYLVKLSIALIVAAMWSIVHPLAADLAITDALAERLDGINGPNTRAVAEYLRDSTMSRTIGFGIILSFWTVAVLGINFLVDEVFNNRLLNVQKSELHI